uniref:Sel1 repeat-containing protein n=1 Tax=Chromera velia CCMP2878 TaxID=1169474 RepID=A0A0G4I1R4_9ALVE|eukprot:Cvel_1681.t1-p1 / transcript=Cvel_1681.t1 / gene=Cvel_1681 / organism=Chromera_velia_CCMP2878 / gene_product=hypothetical protein / transcript_product=hypothetical protein / location=Cvel_scaffold60:98883-109040(-) / protein_length=375 / sequence_SO=supercontig / SO=protein_coding / is_pseudo=false
MGFCWEQVLGTDLEESERRAREGDVECQPLYGEVCYYGKGRPVDVCEAAIWFQRAAFRGHADAAKCCLGLCYTRGEVVSPVDDEEAFDLLHQSALQGSSAAQVNLAECYQHSLGVSADLQKAKHWYEIARSTPKDPETLVEGTTCSSSSSACGTSGETTRMTEGSAGDAASAAKGVESPETIPLKHFSLVCTFGVDVDTVVKVQNSADGFAYKQREKCIDIETVDKFSKLGQDVHSFLESPENNADALLEASIEEMKKDKASFIQQKEEEDGKGVALRGASPPSSPAFSSLQREEEGKKAWYPHMLIYNYYISFAKIPTAIFTITFGLASMLLIIPPFSVVGAFAVMLGFALLFSAPIHFFLTPLLAFFPVPVMP